MSVEAATDHSELLKSLGFVDQDEIKQSAFARLLVLGRPKIGKSTAITLTAPGPVAVLNGDGDSALKYPAHKGAKFHQFDVVNKRTWSQGRAAVAKLAEAGAIKTAVVDTLTFIADSLVNEITVGVTDSRAAYGELQRQIMGGIEQLMTIPAHLIIVAHMIPGKEENDMREGIMPMIAGSSKHKIAAKVNDCVLFDFMPGRQPWERQFIVGPQQYWDYSGRNIRRSCVVEGTVPALFSELGIPL